MRYIDGTVEADNVNKIALDLEYTFSGEFFKVKTAYIVFMDSTQGRQSRTASSINFFEAQNRLRKPAMWVFFLRQ